MAKRKGATFVTLSQALRVELSFKHAGISPPLDCFILELLGREVATAIK